MGNWEREEGGGKREGHAGQCTRGHREQAAEVEVQLSTHTGSRDLQEIGMHCVNT